MEKNELRLQYLPVGVDADAYQKEWDAYLAERSIEQRNRLAEWNMGLVFSVAKTVRKNVFERMEIGDLIGYGMIGLLESSDRYDPSFSVGFASYAVPRIAGSIWRGIEKWVGIPRRLFRKMCQIEMANTVMKQRLQREPDDFEIAKYLEISLHEYRKLQSQIACKTAQSYEEVEVAAPEAFEEECEEKLLTQQMMTCFWQLTCEERQVLRMVFKKGFSLRKIGDIRGTSRWKAEQFLERTLTRLRKGIL